MLNEADRMAKRCCGGVRHTARSNYFHDLHTFAHYVKLSDFLFIAISKRQGERDSSYRRNSGDHNENSR